MRGLTLKYDPEIRRGGMEKFIIKGKNRLKGKVKISGAKNATLKLMAASLLADKPCFLSNVPQIKDVAIMSKVLTHLGCSVEEDKDQLVIKPTLSKYEAPYELISQMRASIIVLGPLLGRLGKAKVAMPGGCNIGIRKIDIHLKGLEALGAEIAVEHGFIEAEAKVLQGANILLDFPSVGATENILMAAVLAQGKTVIGNAAREPEIVDLANFLSKMGAKIKGAGGDVIEVEGVGSLKGARYSVIPDRIEAGTFLGATAVTGGDVTVENVRLSNLSSIIDKLKESGIEVEAKNSQVQVRASSRPKAVNVATLPYPGFPTDMQPQMIALLAKAEGVSVVTENVFENRFMFVDELKRMGCDIVVKGHHAIVKGKESLSSAPVKASDLRGGAALVLASLAADGITEVDNICHIDRGYENFEGKLVLLGADITRSSYEGSKDAVPQTDLEKASTSFDFKGSGSGKGRRVYPPL